jgi:hypothetical protein
MAGGAVFARPIVTAAGGEPEPGEDTAIGIATVTNTSGSTQTNQIVEFMFPTGPSEIAAGQGLRVYDDNGSGAKGSLLDFQVTQIASAQSKQRMGKVRCTVPSIAGSASRKLHIEASATAAPTGTAITASDILATDYQVQATINVGGTNYVADARTALGGSAWDADGASLHGVISGPLATTIVVSMPFMNGATPLNSGEWPRAVFHITAHKVGTGSVGSSPIVYVDTDLIIENGNFTAASPGNLLCGLLIERPTSLSDATLISSNDTDAWTGKTVKYSCPRSQPAVTLTLSGQTAGTTVNFTRASGAWDADILGAQIVNAGGAGRARVIARSSDTVVSVYIYQTFGASSYTSGNWTVEGMGQWYGSRWRFPVYVGTKPQVVTLAGDHSSAITPTTNALMQRWIDAKAMRKYGYPFASVNHATGIASLDAHCVSGVRRPFATLGGSCGEMVHGIGNGGDRIEIGPEPGWVIEGAIKPDADGKRRIIDNADWFATWSYASFRRYSGSPSTGVLGAAASRADSGTLFTTNGAFPGTPINYPSDVASVFTADLAHHAHPHFGAYLLTGKLFYLEQLQMQTHYSLITGCDSGYGNGEGMDNGVFGLVAGTRPADYPLGNRQQRQVAWTLEDLIAAWAATPDTDNDGIWNAKSYLAEHVENQWIAGTSSITDLTGTDGDDLYDATSGPVWFGDFTTNFSVWQLDFVIQAMKNALLRGADDANFDTMYNIMLDRRLQAYSSSDVAPDYAAMGGAGGYLRLMNTDTYPTNPVNQTWAEIYKATCNTKPSVFYEASWRVPSSITLSATSGASVSVDVAVTGNASPFLNGDDAFYVGGWIQQLSGGSGAGQITSVTDGNTVVIDTTVSGGAAFSSTTPTASGCAIPGPHPADAAADGTQTGIDSNYMALFRQTCLAALDRGRSGAAAAVSYIEGATGYPTPNSRQDVDAE